MRNPYKYLIILIILAAVFKTGSLKAAKTGTWEYYKEQFISKDGRVIDHYNGSISHSEGQGYGMILAVMYNDKDQFNRIYNWTLDNLMVRKDNLSAWKWGHRINKKWGIVDYNNATDGDILIAWALFKAYDRWKIGKLKVHAFRILDSIKKNLIVAHAKSEYFIPGYYGFDTENKIVVNPSYYVYPALNVFARFDNSSFWNTLAAKGLEITFDNLYTKLRLPADWLNIDGNNKASVNNNKNHDFGYDAIRIPLYQIMGDKKKELLTFMPYIKLIRKIGYVPIKVDLTENQISIEEAPGGFYAVFALVAKELHMNRYSRKLFLEARIKLSNENKDYYSHTLFLLANKAFKK